MKRAVTAAQQAGAKERRERFRQIVKSIATMTPEQQAGLSQGMSPISCDGHTYSPANQMLLALQCPAGTIFGGFRQWKQQGRSVRKGEHGHMIWVPVKTASAEPSPFTDTGEGYQEDEQEGVTFFIGTVFDVRQTEEMGHADFDDRALYHAVQEEIK